MHEVMKRREASLQGHVRYYPGYPCRNGHDSQRYVSNGACVECLRPRGGKYAGSLSSVQSFRLSVVIPKILTAEERRNLSIWIQTSCLPSYLASIDKPL